MSEDWLWQTAAELGRGIGAGRIDPVALTDTYLAAIDGHADSARIYARTTPDRARAEAKAAAERARAGLRRSPLDGVPISWKDLYDSAGVATEGGSALLKGRVPERDARLLANATAAGLVCLGKTHLSELAFSGLGLNPVTATPPNANDPEAVPGGSSSGAAASVAFGLAAAGIGSDTGGSVRVPAAWNDLVGLKSSHGRLSLAGALPLCESFDTAGPLCRSVEDAALLLAALEGGRAPDLRGAAFRGTRLMVLTTGTMDALRDEPRAGFESAIDRLQAAGAEIEWREIPLVAEMLKLSPVLYATEAYGTWKETIEAAPDKMFPMILERFRGGAAFGGADFVAAWRDLRRYRAGWAREAAQYDAVIIPTTPNMPPNAARLMEDHSYYVTENLLTLSHTRIGNLLDLCGLTLPTGLPSAGVLFMAPPGQEERLLRIGAAAEAALA
ncbi:amidase family protein [Psychromarinibacter sp. C21-152]|uniref:Amidase family protein n=1 Tax=Psychromarinibacter sediminicola TaxID=3033385 RepID=A0AAE3T7Y7_9RHOB|nr:amidase family protein [Psychromarinibacter sediminicola]MDF0600682.1 amidase family protein [Psychromarinibacter sediminicola]